MSDFLECKCPACGGKIEFDTGRQKLTCPFCGTEYASDALESFADDLGDTSKDNMNWSVASGQFTAEEVASMSMYKCKSCGGEIVGTASLGATTCPYCDSPVVMTGQFAGDLKPDMVLPFKLDKRAAKEALQKHISKKKMVPGVFKQDNHIDEIKGVYIPFWLFDAKANARIKYKATKVERWSDDKYDYEATSHYSIKRAGSLNFKEVPVNGSTNADNKMMESVEPFSTKDAVPFSTGYLAGFMADKYDISSEQCSERANERIRTSTEEAFRSTVKGYDTVTAEKSTISLDDATARYALCPVWLLNTTWNGQKFTFAVNGQTGKIVGDLPTDRRAFWLWLLGTTIGSAAIAYGIFWIISLM